MTKQELISKVSEQTGIATKEVAAILDATINTIKETVAADDAVTLRGFGTFAKKLRKEKVVQNISKGTSMILPSHYVPLFKASKEFKEVVK